MLHYFIFYKPHEVLSQFSREGDKKTLADFFHSLSKDVYPVGRLDYDSEGLLFLTNDKQVTHRLLEPKHQHARTYYVQVEGAITGEAIRELENGVNISVNGKPYLTAKAVANILPQEPRLPERNPPIRFRKNIPTSWLALTITEGKNRQVRKMTAAVGFPTLRLVRYSIGNIDIAGMESGDIRELDAEEVKQLFS
ncbi:MAG TPA: pseudouridine synthase [Flavipsychrobacter sp.]|nr:pseudouridine synthase [Flavipsychrobacter sp.]